MGIQFETVRTQQVKNPQCFGGVGGIWGDIFKTSTYLIGTNKHLCWLFYKYLILLCLNL